VRFNYTGCPHPRTAGALPENMKKLGTYVDNSPKTWVQTERAAHEAWGLLSLKSPRAAALLHTLVANMSAQNAVVTSQATLAKMLRCDPRTIRRAIEDLESDNWIQVVSMGGAGTVNAYVVNDQVAWGEKRDNMPRLSLFSARVIADIEDQSENTLARSQLRKIPVIYPNERQLPTGPGAEPPSQPAIPGMEPDLPALEGDAKDRHELETKYGQGRLA
jgi:DNA-binding transcriptional regulator YhcF (GntR family)